MRTTLGVLLFSLMLQPLTITAQDAPLVFIDPGHGGDVAGVVVGDLVEKDLVLRLGFFVAEAFAEAGYETRMTRTGDEQLSFQERVTAAEAAGAQLFLSLHMNRNDDPSLWGTQIFLAEEIPQSLAAGRAIGAALEGIGGQATVIGREFGVLKSTVVPTIMVELGYLTNPVEARLLVSEAYWAQAAEALVQAADDFLGR